MKKLLGILGTVLGITFVLLVIVAVPFSLPLLLFLGLLYGWVFHAFVLYQQGRQEELLHLLTTAAESNAPLAPVLRAYLRDRPRGRLREFWVALMLFFVLPGYYWLWHRRRSFDRKIGRVARRLEDGESLPDALQAVPGVVSRQAVLAAAVGQATGQLGLCLRRSSNDRLAALVLEVLPRLLYPLILLFFMSGVLGFWLYFLLPRMQRILADFDIQLPELTSRVASLADLLVGQGRLLLAFLAGVAFVVLLLASPGLRWYLPWAGRLYRLHIQGRVLRLLSVLLEAGKPVPEALGILTDPVAFPRIARRRLQQARLNVEQGQPLPEALQHAGILPHACVPLIQAAQRSQRLPWTLGVLGEELTNRSARLLTRTVSVVFPLCIALTGVLVGFIAIGMFLPLVDLIWRLSE